MHWQNVHGDASAPKVVIKGYIMKKAISLATPADVVYASELKARLPDLGRLVEPGSIFGQRPGSFHLRLPIQPHAAEGWEDFWRFHAEHPQGWFR